MKIIQGQYNEIHPTAQIIPYEGDAGDVILGDCNTIHENVRIFVGPSGFKMGDWNIIHRDTTIIGSGECEIGHNCWIGQGAYLDHTGHLYIKNGVTIGVGWHIWTHLGRGEQIEGWRCETDSYVVLEDDVWLVGNGGHVAPGVRMGHNSSALALSAVTQSVLIGDVVAGVPARPISIILKKDVTLQDKFNMMREWIKKFCSTRSDLVWTSAPAWIHVFSRDDSDHEVITVGYSCTNILGTYFDLANKTYTKRLTQLERDFIKFLKNNKARFIPA